MLFLEKLRAKLPEQYIDYVTEESLNRIPKYWYKNADILAEIIKLYVDKSKKSNKISITTSDLNDISKKTGIRMEDLIRYWRLVERSFKEN